VFIIAPFANAQKRMISITVEHIEVKDITHSVNDNISDEETIQLLSLERKRYHNWYYYYTFPNCSNRRVGLSNGMELGTYSSSVLDINVLLKGQVLEMEIKNNTPYWLSIDMSSISYDIFHYDSTHDYYAPYTGADLSSSIGLLFNMYRGGYNVIVIPPKASTNSSFYRIDERDIIGKAILDESRLDFQLKVNLYLEDPFSQQISKMKKPTASAFGTNTPIEKIIRYEGAFLKDGESIRLYEGNEDYLLPEYKAFLIKCVCSVNVTGKMLQTHIDDCGLEVYGN
jgi:hypothetical protein